MRFAWIRMRHVQLLGVIITCSVLVLGGAFGFEWYRVDVSKYKTASERDPYVRFDMEAYDDIATNYWRKSTDTDLANFFALSLQKAANLATVPTLKTHDRAGTALMLETAFNTATSTTAKRALATQVINVALFNLSPIGRDELLSKAQEKQLQDEVSNINHNKNLYQDLGLDTGASVAAIDVAYKQKIADLAIATSTDVTAERQTVTYAYGVLKNPNTKALYDKTQVEPTVFARTIGSSLYVYIDRISPTTLQEFGMAIETASTTPHLSSLVLDLRGNLGGDLSFASSFLGLLVGQNQYAFDLFHQDDYQVQRTPIAVFPELARYKEIAVLTDNMTQSTAELTTVELKKYHLATVIGTRTRGWGSVENTFPLTAVIDPSTSYTLLLVTHLTLREDNLPIESNGVLPDVDITDKNWTDELSAHIRSQSLIDAVKQTVSAPPSAY